MIVISFRLNGLPTHHSKRIALKNAEHLSFAICEHFVTRSADSAFHETQTEYSRSMDESTTENDGRAIDYEYTVESGEEVSTAVLLAISDITGNDVDELSTLSEILDPDKLNGLCDSFEQEGAQVSFDHHGFHVTIHGAETVTLRKRE